MTKLDIIYKLMVATGLTKEKATDVIECLLSTIKESVSEHDSVLINGFGGFHATKQKQRLGRDIKRGTTVIIPERMKVVFKPSKQFINSLNDENKEEN